MAHSEARAWWADVQHLRNDYERTDEARRRADEADLASRRATRERHHVEAEVKAAVAATQAESADAPTHRPDPAFSSRRGQRGEHFDLSPAPRVRQGVGPATGARSARVKGDATPGRVTVEIRGRTVPAPAVPRSVEVERRRPPRRAVERVGTRPDRVAMWALMMGLLLILVALGTADGPAVISLTLR